MKNEEILKKLESFCIERIVYLNSQDDDENPDYVTMSMEGRKSELKRILIDFFNYNNSDIDRINI